MRICGSFQQANFLLCVPIWHADAKNSIRKKKLLCSVRLRITLLPLHRLYRMPASTVWQIFCRQICARDIPRFPTPLRRQAIGAPSASASGARKVTAILYSLLDRYRKEGARILRGTQIWVCSVCGFTYVGQTPPELCPVCKVPAWKFEKVEGRESA